MAKGLRSTSKTSTPKRGALSSPRNSQADATRPERQKKGGLAGDKPASATQVGIGGMFMSDDAGALTAAQLAAGNMGTPGTPRPPSGSSGTGSKGDASNVGTPGTPP